jgi:hypothetical protein
MNQNVLIPLKWNNSIVLFIGHLLYNIIAVLSVFTWVVYFYESSQSKKVNQSVRIPMIGVEIYVLLLLFIEICSLLIQDRSLVFIILALYGLIDILVATLRDVILSPAINKEKSGEPFISIRNPERWFLMTLINISQTIVCFSILIFQIGSHYPDGSCNFNIEIENSLSALYYSMVTFCTVGYGDIYPVQPLGKYIVIAELAFFVLLFLLKLPIALSLFKVKLIDEQK